MSIIKGKVINQQLQVILKDHYITIKQPQIWGKQSMMVNFCQLECVKGMPR